MSHVLKNKVTNVVFETVSDGGSITLEAEFNVFNCYEPKYLWDKENEVWIEHTFKAHDANEFEVVTDITLPDDFVNGKYDGRWAVPLDRETDHRKAMEETYWDTTAQ